MLCWSVYRYDINSDVIETVNILSDRYFYDTLLKLKKKYLKRDTQDFVSFFEELKKEFRYIFWARCEYEVVIDSVFQSCKHARKIDIYEQITMNWEPFQDYIKAHWKEIKKKV